MELSERFTDALVFATQLHGHQVRKVSGEPYIAHLLAVAGLVLENGGSEDEAIAALLHDTIEDQGGAAIRDRIAQRFGREVLEIVDGCTDSETAPGTPKLPWQQRKDRYLARLPHESASVRLVSAADKLHNARSLLAEYRRRGESLWAHFRGGREGTLWYHRAVADTLSQFDSNPLVAELDRTVSELERLAER